MNNRQLHWVKLDNAAKIYPVIFVPCDFGAIALYLAYINLSLRGSWFFPFALPLTVFLALIVCTVVTLTRYLRRGWLYIFGGATIALGAWIFLLEQLLVRTFQITFMGWSVYPMAVLVLLGFVLIYLAINPVARETLQRKLFF